jgi:glycerol kinase
VLETTALGAACLAGITVGFWKDMDDVKKHWHKGTVFEPLMDTDKRDKFVAGWKKAVERSLNWA